MKLNQNILSKMTIYYNSLEYLREKKILKLLNEKVSFILGINIKDDNHKSENFRP